MTAMLRMMLVMVVVVCVAGFATSEGQYSMQSGDQAAVASMIRNATFLERTPEFTDLYIIKTWDKGRQITIYCNSAYCYKSSGQAVKV